MEKYSNFMVSLDEKDIAILRELEENAKRTTGIIAKRTGIAVTTVHNRVKRFEKEGIIKKYAPVLDYGKLGQGIHALIFLTVESKSEGKAVNQEEIAKKALKIDGVMSALILTGTYDMVLSARIASVDALNTLLIKRLRGIGGIDKTQTMLVLKEILR